VTVPTYHDAAERLMRDIIDAQQRGIGGYDGPVPSELITSALEIEWRAGANSWAICAVVTDASEALQRDLVAQLAAANPKARLLITAGALQALMSAES
jgi:5'-deoxynucleotidase YfbR-like HD superfamily hydrolase